MADIIGAFAGCGMIFLIMMLVGNFLAEIHIIRRETILDMGRVLLCCGVFTAVQYGLMVLIRMVCFGMQDMLGFMDMVQHRAFYSFWDQPENTALYAITIAVVCTSVSGWLIFHSMKAGVGKGGAMKAVILFFLLPGMGWAFMPFWACWVALAFAILLCVLKKLRLLPLWKMPETLYGSLCVLFAMLRCFMLFRLVMGV